MKITRALTIAVIAVASMSANATVVGSLGGGSGTFLMLSSVGLNDGLAATLSGGTVYTSDLSFASMPAGSLIGENFLAAGVSSGSAATLSFTGSGVSYVSFLWGSPDTYNRLVVNSSDGSFSFDVENLGFSVTNGDQDFSQYVEFTGLDGARITGLQFTNLPGADAFEVANFNVRQAVTVTAIPEPATAALVLAGLAAFGFAAWRRRA